MRLGTAVIVEDRNGRFLLHLRDKQAHVLASQWSLITGRVRDGEMPVAAAKREVMEEANLEITGLREVDCFIYDDEVEIHVFHGLVEDPEPLKVLEGADMRWFRKEDLRTFIDSLEYSNCCLERSLNFLEVKI